jgi:molybdopterin converting factor small subunit
MMEKVTVEIKVHGRFRELFDKVQFSYLIRPGETVETLIEKLGLPSEAPDLWVLVDHIPAERDHVLKPGDLVIFFQPVAGG